MVHARLAAISQEFCTVDLGDKRLNRRLLRLADAMAAAPTESLPKACRTGAALEAAYRLLSNPRVTPEQILQPHVSSSWERAAGTVPIVVVHDTTEFAFSGEAREHLGRTNNGQPGFFAHVSLGLRLGTAEPIGVLHNKTYARTSPPMARKQRWKKAYSGEVKESDRWCEAALAVDDEGAGRAPLIHVADREGDQYRLMSAISERGSHFIIRAQHDRVLADDAGHLWEAIIAAPLVFERDVALSKRTPKHGKASHGARVARTARLSVSSTSVELQRGRWPGNSAAPKTLEVNAVRVVEIDAPVGQEQVEWVLLTNLPVDTAVQIETIVDAYRLRWTVEEFFKAVKSGCSYEKLQLENELALRNALSIVLPIAWQMLLLRQLARTAPERSASVVLTTTQLAVLAENPWVKVPRSPTVKDALAAIAAIGGHIKNNGDPGWQVLYRGFRDLMLLEIGWRARSDQS